MPEASVIISTYNRPAHLERCLEGFRQQTELDFEVIVADDGSGGETAEVIRAAARDYPIPLHHAWQEDQGYRLAAVKNLGFRFSSADYLIFTDSDCIPHRNYVKAHLHYRAPGRCLAGRVVKWGAKRTERLDLADIQHGRHARIGPLDVWDMLRKRNRYLPYGIRLPGEWSFRLVQHLKKNHNPRGGNMSLWRSDLMRVNGWNEDFKSWGLEDIELGQRLRLDGIEMKVVINKACMFHLYHPGISRKSRSARIAYDASKARGLPWCPNGLVRAETPPGISQQPPG